MPQRLNRCVWQRNAIATRQRKHQLGLEAALDVDVHFAFWQTRDQGVNHLHCTAYCCRDWRPAGRTANLYIRPVIIVICQAINWQLSAGMHFRPIAVDAQQFLDKAPASARQHAIKFVGQEMGAPLQGRPASRRIKTSGARNSGDGSTEELHFYVCGDAERIAKDVDIVLRMVVSQHGGFSEDDADAYVNRMAQEKRYVRDVY